MSRPRRLNGRAGFDFSSVVQFLQHIKTEKTMLPLLIPLILMLWIIERWVFFFSNWVPLVLAVWVTVQYSNYQRELLVEDLNKRWQRVVLKSSPITPLESCEWLNKMLMEVWQSYVCPKFSMRFASIVEKRLRKRKPKLIEKLELQEFTLGTCPPSLGLKGTRWSTLSDQRILHIDFNWDTTDMSILLMAKLAKPLSGTAKIVISSMHISGDLLLMPVLDGKAIIYSFLSTPVVRIGVAFGSGGSQSLPSTELPGVSSWLEKLFSDTLTKTMVEPRRRCFSLPTVDLRKKAVAGIIHATVVSASQITRSSLKTSPSKRQQKPYANGGSEEKYDDKDIETFIEIELENLTRRTSAKTGTNPIWNSSFNMVLHEETGTIRFNLFSLTAGSPRYDFIASCEIKIKYAADDSTTFWAIGPDSSVIAKHIEFCGKEVMMAVPFEGVPSGELIVKLVLKEWHFSNGSFGIQKANTSQQPCLNGTSNLHLPTGRKLFVTVLEGKDFVGKERSGKCDPYVKLKYGKVTKKSKISHGPAPNWNQRFEFDELEGGEDLMVRCFGDDIFGDDSLGNARVNLEGLVEGSRREVWIPLENVRSGELLLKIEASRTDDPEGSKTSASSNGWIELVLIEAKDLIAADLRGTSDPYVRVHYGNIKKKTKVLFRTLTPRWNQTLEFPEDGSPLELHVKDYNSLLPTSSIGNCVVEYQRLPANQMFDKWIPLEGVRTGEIHIQITRKVPVEPKRASLESETSLTKPNEASREMRKLLTKLRSSVEEADLDGAAAWLSELESLQDTQDDYHMLLETEQALLMDKIKEIGEEIMNPSSHSRSRRSFG